ncbi:hypothetical protein ABPG74_015983 [Tetrahymena malaccensis]
MFFKLKRINSGLRYYFSSNQQQNSNQNYFNFKSQDQHSTSQQSANNFQFKNEENHQNNHNQGSQNPQYDEIELPPFSDQQDEDEKQDENKIQYSSQEINHDDPLQQKYDVAIIGGGSAGLSFALEAHKLGLKTILFNFVEPTYRGNKWGLGGTCVNVGCIPKKLFHTASLIKDSLLKSADFGFGADQQQFKIDQDHHDEPKNKKLLNFRWRQLVSNVQNYISDLNLGFEAQLINRNIPYVNALATLGDKNTIYYTTNKQDLYDAIQRRDFSNLVGQSIKADYIVLAVGGRPKYIKECENSEKYSITSDDIFSLKNSPGKTLVLGSGYIAFESAGFLSNLGMDTTLMARGQYLREFDQDVAQMIVEDMKQFNGVRFIQHSIPYKIEKNDKDYVVCYKSIKTNDEQCDKFQTILQAVGRQPNISLLNLDQIGVQVHSDSQKIIGGHNNDSERTSVDNIFSVGDVLHGVPELNPIAQMAGKLLAHRIFGLKMNDNMKYYNRHKMDYNCIPTTLFTPQEYSFIGLNEEQALKQYGKDRIEVYHSRFTPLEEQLTFSYDEEGNIIKRKSYCKLICDKFDNNRIVGMHYFGPNAGEVMQGYAVAFKMNLFKHQLDSTVGIHPTCAEELLNLKITKSSGENFDKDTC